MELTMASTSKPKVDSNIVTTTTVIKEQPTQEPTVTPEPEPSPEPQPSVKEEEQHDPMKTACLYCKVKSIASLALSLSLVVMVLAFSFNLVKTAK